jgi:hypothetical protein
MSDSKVRYTHVRDIGFGAANDRATNPEETTLEQIEVNAPSPSPQPAAVNHSQSASRPAPPPPPPPPSPNTQVETLDMPPPLDTKNEDYEREIKEDVFHEREQERERERERERTHSRTHSRWNWSLFEKSGAKPKELPKEKYNLAKQVSALSNPRHNAIAIGAGLSLLGFTLWNSNLPTNI